MKFIFAISHLYTMHNSITLINYMLEIIKYFKFIFPKRVKFMYLFEYIIIFYFLLISKYEINNKILLTH